MKAFIYGLVFAGVILLFASAVSAATYEGKFVENNQIYWVFNQDGNVVVCEHKLGGYSRGDVAKCRRGVDGQTELEKVLCTVVHSSEGYIGDCKREDW